MSLVICDGCGKTPDEVPFARGTLTNPRRAHLCTACTTTIQRRSKWVRKYKQRRLRAELRRHIAAIREMKEVMRRVDSGEDPIYWEL